MASTTLISSGALIACRQQLCAKPRRAVATIRRAAPVAYASSKFKVTFKLPEGRTEVIECADDQYILDAVEEAGVDLSVVCSAGGCQNCAGKVISGIVDQSDQRFLDEEQMKKGFAILCTSRPQSDVVISVCPAMC